MKTSTRIISILCIVTLLVSCLGMSLGISAVESPITSTVFWQNSAQTADRISHVPDHCEPKIVTVSGEEFTTANEITIKNAAAYYGRWGHLYIYQDSGAASYNLTDVLTNPKNLKLILNAKISSNGTGTEHFALLFKNNAWVQVGEKTFSVENDGNWHKIEISLSDMTGLAESNLLFLQLVNDENYDGTMSDNDTLSLADMKLVEETENTPEKPNIVNVESNRIILAENSDLEYSIDGGETWQTSNIFTDLEPNTQYSIIARYKGLTKTSEALIVTTALANTQINAERAYWNNSAADAAAVTGFTNEIAEVSDSEYFTKANAITISNSDDFCQWNMFLNIYSDGFATTAMPKTEYLENTKLVFYVKLPSAGTGTENLVLEFRDGSWNQKFSVEFSVSEHGTWQRIEIPMSEHPECAEQEIQFARLRTKDWGVTTLAVNDVIYISPMSIKEEAVIELDLNGDGSVNALDISALRFSLLTDGTVYDLNFDKSFNILDLIFLKKYIAENLKPGEEPGFYEGGVTHKDTSSDFSAYINDYHPGVPGYSNIYHVTAAYKNTATSDFTLTSSISGVICGNNEISISPEAKEANSSVDVTAVYNGDASCKTVITINLKKWETTLSDDFDTYNTKLWKGFELNSVRTANPYAVVKDTGVYVKDGKLFLEPKIETTVINGYTYNYSSAAISTKETFSQNRGCFTAKIKTADKGGILNGFWILPEGTYGKTKLFAKTDEDKKSCGEIDIIENHAHNAQGNAVNSFGASAEHYWDSDTAKYIEGKGTSYNSVLNTSFDINEFYEYSCVWTDKTVYYYINGKLAGKTDNIKTDKKAAPYIILSAYTAPDHALNGEVINGVKGINNGWFGFLKDEDYGSAMQIDYLRVYK